MTKIYHFSIESAQLEPKTERRMFTRPSSSSDGLSEIAEEATVLAEKPIVKRSGFEPFSEKMQVRNHGAAKLYVSVGEDVEDGKSSLVWAARNFLQAGDPKLVLLHVHNPAAHRIMTGSMQKSYMEETSTPLNQYLDFCRLSLKIQAETLEIEKNSPANGIIELIDQHHITSLVMGTSSNSPQKKAPSSKVAGSVHLQAKPYCQIFYICNQKLACTREATRLYAKVESPQRCVSDQPEFPYSSFEMISDSEENISARRPWLSLKCSQYSAGVSPDLSLNCSQHSTGVSSGFSLNSTEGSLVPVSVASSEEHQYSMAKADIQHEVFEQLERVLINKPERSIKEAQQKTERDLFEASMMFKARENSLLREKKEVEERLSKEKTVLEKEHIRIHKELQKANEQMAEMERKLLQANSLLKEELQREKDRHAAAQMMQLKRGNTCCTVTLTEFSYEEINEATDGFGDSKKIGQGGCGSVYKGFIRRTAVAIKKINRSGAEGEKEFNDEVETLCRMRHPNLVTLIGVCREAKALVFELLSNGSLEDCLQRDKHQIRKQLSWRTRTRIAADICTGLIYLHSNKPKGIVHGDLKPANVLLDTNFVCKLADFGISRRLDLTNTSATAYHRTDQIRGTMGYMDPVYIASGELTAQHDVYSFGVVLLRLLTGKNPLRLPNKVESALRNHKLQDMIDTSAGDWPTQHAHVLATLALRCCRYDRKERPDLAKEAWGVLQAMISCSSTETSSPEMPATNVLIHLPNDTGDREETRRGCRWIC